MKMLRSSSTLSSNRSLLVLLVLLLVLVGIAAGRTLMASSFGPAAPVYGPAENPASAPPAVQASSVPAIEAPVPIETAIPGGNTAAPAPGSIYPATPTARAAATVVPHATVPVGPATSADPGRDIPAVAPESSMPGFTPPPSRE